MWNGPYPETDRLVRYLARPDGEFPVVAGPDVAPAQVLLIEPPTKVVEPADGEGEDEPGGSP